MCKALKITQQMIPRISNRYQELSNNGDIGKESNTGDYVKPAKAAE